MTEREEFLDGFEPKARPEFRSELRESFLGAAAVEGHLDGFEPEARDEFRDELRAKFAVAAKPQRLRPVKQSPVKQSSKRPTRTSARHRSRSEEPAERRSLPTWAWAGPVALAAALAVLLFLLPPGEDTPAFQVHSSFVAAGIQVNGEAFDGDAASFATTLAGADTITAGDAPLRLMFRDQFLIEVDPKATLDVSGLWSEEGAYVLAATGDPGAFRVATAAGFDGSVRPLEFHTPARNLQVVGTVFGVDVFDENTVCICCCEGEVHTSCPAGARADQAVTGGETLVTTSQGLMSKDGMEAHQAPLRDLQDMLERWQ